MKSSSHDSRYAFVTGLIRAFEVKGLSGEIISRMIKAESLKEVYELLKGTVYQEFFSIHGEPGDFNEILQWRRNWIQELISAYTYHDGIGKLFLLGYDYHNIKTLLKKKIFNIDVSLVSLFDGTIKSEDMALIFETEKFSLLPEVMRSAIDNAVRIYYENKLPLLIDLAVDRALTEDILDWAEKLRSPFIDSYYALYIDLQNINMLVRMSKIPENEIVRKLLYMPGGNIDISQFKNIKNNAELIVILKQKEYHSLAQAVSGYNENIFSVEKEIDTILAQYLEKAGFFIWGIEPLFVYACETELELKVLGLIFTGIKNRIDPGIISRRMPDLQRGPGL